MGLWKSLSKIAKAIIIVVAVIVTAGIIIFFLIDWPVYHEFDPPDVSPYERVSLMSAMARVDGLRTDCSFSFNITNADLNDTDDKPIGSLPIPDCYIKIDSVLVTYSYTCEMPINSEIINPNSKIKSYETIFPNTCDNSIIIGDENIGKHSFDLVIDNSCSPKPCISWPEDLFTYGRKNSDYWSDDCRSEEENLPYNIQDNISGLKGIAPNILIGEWVYNIDYRLNICIENADGGERYICYKEVTEGGEKKYILNCEGCAIGTCEDICQDMSLFVYFKYNSDGSEIKSDGFIY